MLEFVKGLLGKRKQPEITKGRPQNPPVEPKVRGPPVKLTEEQVEEGVPRALGLGMSHYGAQCLFVCGRLQVFDAIGSDTLSTAEIAARLGVKEVNEEYLERMLRLVAFPSIGALKESAGEEGEVRFALTPLGALYQSGVPQQPSLLCELLHDFGTWNWDAWRALDPCVDSKRRKVPFEEAWGVPIFKAFDELPVHAKPFNELMSIFSFKEKGLVAELYPWEQFHGKVVTDVGGSLGPTIEAVKRQHPKIGRAINFDLPGVVATAPAIEGVEHVAGSFFQAEDLPRSDCFILKHICHDWSDENALAILQACAARLNDGGAVLLCESILPEAGEADNFGPTVKSIDMLMLLIGGKERSLRMWKALAAKAGLQVDDVVATPGPLCQLITLKKQDGATKTA